MNRALLLAAFVAARLEAADPCAPLPPPSGTVVDVTPAQAAQLDSIVAAAATGTTVRLADGLYELNGDTIWMTTPGVTLRSASGNRDAVVIDGEYMGGSMIEITASNVTLADLTVKRAWFHPIHVQPGTGIVTGIVIHNVRVIDPGEQGIKINANPAGFTDYGVIRCSRIELTDAGRPEVRNNCYTGGIDAHRSRGWHIHDNLIEGFWCTTGLSEHGIHMWTGSRDTIVERNVIRNCARGIGFGLGQGTSGRSYPDNPCGGETNIGHYDGIIRNNVVFANDSDLFTTGAGGFDAGIALEEACGTRVLHNTVFSTSPPFSSIEGRFARTSATMTNNLMSHNLRPRDSAVLTLAGNVQNAPANLFVDAAGGDLHLVPGASVIGQGSAVPAGHADEDVDRERRDTASRDVGADEHKPDWIFGDSFGS